MYTILSLFTWCWWLDLWMLWGFKFLNNEYKKHNFRIIWANDIDKNACITFEKNFKHDIICWDIRELIQKDSEWKLDKKIPNDVDIVLWWFPCQDFSLAWKRLWFNAERWTLYQSMVDIVEKCKPKIFLAENVKWLLNMDNWNAIKTIVRDFESKWYNVSYRLLLASDYWVPQKRERIIIVWTRKDILPEFEFPDPVLNEERWITLGEAIWDLEDKEEWYLENHFRSKAKKNNWQGNNCVSKDEPWPTMRSEHHWNIEFHRNGKRRLSAREAARIQSFPDSFIFYPSTSSAYKQIWNAVPPVLAWYLWEAINNFLNKYLNKNAKNN